MVKSNCYKCEKRHFKCHSECDDYKAFRKAKDEENAKVRAERKRDDTMTAYIGRKRKWG